MKKLIAAALGLIMLTGCQGNMGNSDAETTASHIRASHIRADRSNVPAIRYIEMLTANEYTGDDSQLSFIDSDGNRCISSDAELMKLSYAALTEKYAAGELSGYTVQENAVDKDKLAATYDLICNAAEFADYELLVPEMMPDVEASTTTVTAMYYTTDGLLKGRVIYENKCMTSIYSNSGDANEAYEWYRKVTRNT
ncbi:hypothetical protein SAMN02910353_01580 [Ruminococcus sp. YRD2003]|uniref:hypothetical protein n=1 Tax=Ruminococcus sp. YRD2003 TaxID=1452313 RepID=UPI0008B591BE|nr:hypothetical protein SAMN02910353_01580 [Ruminococcus flavefaciens]